MSEAHFEHDYDNDGMAELNEREPREPDPDAQYEKWRDDCSEDLDVAMKELIQGFIDRKNHYYSGNRERTLEHAKSWIEFELSQINKSKNKFVIIDCDEPNKGFFYHGEFARTKNGEPFIAQVCEDLEKAIRFDTKEEAEKVAKEVFMKYEIKEVKK